MPTIAGGPLPSICASYFEHSAAANSPKSRRQRAETRRSWFLLPGARILGGVFIGREAAQAAVEFVVMVWVSAAVWTTGVDNFLSSDPGDFLG